MTIEELTDAIERIHTATFGVWESENNEPAGGGSRKPSRT